MFGIGKKPKDRPHKDLPDAHLVLATRQGDKQAFVEMVARYQALVCGVAFGILGDFNTAQDAGQEAFQPRSRGPGWDQPGAAP